MGALHTGQGPLARESEERLKDLEGVAQRAGETLFARSIGVLRLSLSAWIANAVGDRRAAIVLMRKAVELEAQTPKHAVTPAPTIPALELLGDLLMQQGNPREALAAYEGSLAVYPNRLTVYWALLALRVRQATAKKHVRSTNSYAASPTLSGAARR
jgi:tetratricopeptide (TPR) repeat protein